MGSDEKEILKGIIQLGADNARLTAERDALLAEVKWLREQVARKESPDAK